MHTRGFTYTYDENVGEQCTSVFSTPVRAYRPVTTLYTTSIPSSGYFLTDWTTDYDSTSNTTMVPTGTIYAGVINIYWQASDLSLFGPSYSSRIASAIRSKGENKLGVTVTATATGLGRPFGQTSTASPGATTNFPGPTSLSYSIPSPSGNALSVGGIVGVVLGSVIGATLLALAAFLVLRRRKRRAAEARSPEAKHMTSVEAPELIEYENPGRAAGRESYQP